MVRGETPQPPPPPMEKQSRSTHSNGSASIVGDESGKISNGGSLDDLPQEGNGSGAFPKARALTCVVS